MYFTWAENREMYAAFTVSKCIFDISSVADDLKKISVISSWIKKIISVAPTRILLFR